MTIPFLFHSQADGLKTDGDRLTVTLKTEDQKFEKVLLRCEPDNEEMLLEMQPAGREGRLKLWRVSFIANHDQDLTHYLFKVLCGNRSYWLDDRGVHKRMPGREFHFKFNRNHQPPAWVSEQIFYQIFPERFCNGKPEISVKDGEYAVKNGTRPVVAKQWGEPTGCHSGMGGAEFYGGDLYGIGSKLDYLQELGVTTLYLNPIFSSLSNHKYDTTDYFSVDPHFGDNKYFAQLCNDIHQRGMKIVLDAVFNHTSADHPWFDKQGKGEGGAYHNPGSVYRDYYFFDGNSKDYSAWKGVQNLPVLNFSHQPVRDYIYQGDQAVIRHWLREPYKVDGWRFDVIHMLGEGEGAANNAHYVQAFRLATKEENPQAYVLGEHFFEASQWLKGDQEDGAMNYYGFAHPVRALLAGKDIAYHPTQLDMEDFVEWVTEAKARVPFANQLTQLNQLDSHDTARFLTTLGDDEAKMKLASVLLFAYPGTPCLYYGTEVGLQGSHDPDNRRCFPWERVETSPWLDFYKQLIALRRERVSLQSGALVPLYCDPDTWVFGRQKDGETTLCAFNLSEQERQLSIPVWKLGIEQGEVISLTDDSEGRVGNGFVPLSLAPVSGMLFGIK